jgi:hypothetical protein
VIKLIVMIRRRPGLTLEEFRSTYEQEHAPLFARSIPPEVQDAIVSYAQNHAVALPGSKTDPPFDVVSEFVFEDLEAMRRWTGWYLGPEGKVLRDDEERFMDVSSKVVLVSEERVLPHRPG